MRAQRIARRRHLRRGGESIWSRVARARLLLVLATFVYAWALHYAHAEYLNPVWSYFGFSYRPLGLEELRMGGGLLLLGAILMPTVLGRVSSVILLCLYVAVYVPTVVYTLGLETDRLRLYGPALVAIGLVFALSCLVARTNPRIFRGHDLLPSRGLMNGLVTVWAVFGVVLIATFAPVMSFVGFDDVYEQRFVGRSSSVVIGYMQTYFGLVLSPGLIAIGLATSRRLFYLLGTLGCLILYLIDAQRTVFLLPLAILLLHLALRSRYTILRTTMLPLLLLSVVVVFSTTYYGASAAAASLARYVTFRTLGFPGLTYSLYYDLFRMDGFTWWSHVRGISRIVPTPMSYVHEPDWPALGYIVASRMHDMRSNANANFYAGDGVAAAGPLGTVVIGVLFTVYLFALDRFAMGWNRHFAMLLVLPIGITLMNGPFFTTMLSFGGLFWLLVLYVWGPHGFGRVGNGRR